MREVILTNARIVAPDRVFTGAVRAVDGRIVDLSETPVRSGLDCEGDYLLPGLVELHTDNLERHLRPRPGVHWPRRAAVAAHDGEMASVGVTTVLDALRIGIVEKEVGKEEYVHEVAEALGALKAAKVLRCDHFIHLRCELCTDNLLVDFAKVADEPDILMISLMDHTPGQRQFRKMEKLREYYVVKHHFTEERFQNFVTEGIELQKRNLAPNLAGIAEGAKARGLHIASHDDTTEEHVAESADLGASMAEFPTTLEAARASRAAGMKIIMGAPNLLRGQSHSGNVSALDLAEEGLVDILSSDYAPAAMMLAAFKLAEETDYSLPAAIETITAAPARAVGLEDRGALAPGMRADFARVYHTERLCVTRGLWREGRQVG